MRLPLRVYGQPTSDKYLRRFRVASEARSSKMLEAACLVGQYCVYSTSRIVSSELFYCTYRFFRRLVWERQAPFFSNTYLRVRTLTVRHLEPPRRLSLEEPRRVVRFRCLSKRR